MDVVDIAAAWETAAAKADAAEAGVAGAQETALAPRTGSDAARDAKAAQLGAAPEVDEGAGTEEETDEAEEPEASGDDAGAEASGDEPGEADEDASADPEQDRETDLDTIRRLAKKHGLRFDTAEVSRAERVQLRAEKRKFHESQKRKADEFQRQLQAAEQHYAPALQAMRMLEDRDVDGALKALGFEGGMDEATKVHLEVANGKHPSTYRLERQLAEERRLRQEREKQESERQAEAERERVRKEHMHNVSREIGDIDGLSGLAENEWFLDGVLQIQEQHYDGFDTLSPEDAAAEYRAWIRQNPRMKQAFNALRWAFGDRGANDHESSDASRGADQSSATSESRGASRGADRDSENSERQGGNKKPSKTLPKRRAAEASPRADKRRSDKELMALFTAKLAAAAG